MLRALPVLLLLASAAPSLAAESTPVRSVRAVASLVSDTDRVEPGKPFHVGLLLRLAPGWHTYWRNPGDAGVPPEIDLTLPEGASAGPIAWPAPERLPEGPLMTYGYTGPVTLPLTVTPGSGAQHIEASASWLVCEKICVPEEGRFTLDLPSGPPAPSAEAPLFAAAAARLPVASPFPARIAADGTLSLTGPELSPTTVRDAWFIPSAPGAVTDSAAQSVVVRDGAVLIRLKLEKQVSPGSSLAGVVGLRDGRGQESALEVNATPGPAPEATGLPVWQAIGFALLGGLILNLMPCVFPILAMKALGLVRLSGGERGEVRGHAAFYTAGVVLTFTALGAVLVGARALGSAAGWGFQLQSPVFVAVLAWVLFAVGLNLSGVFQVGSRLAGVGEGLAGRRGHLGSFFTGLLAVVVATPCTAPFMGAAIAAALAAPVALTLAVFVAMGVGMAAPYALLALLPGLARRLPRPGPWMDVLRGALAFPMYGAAVWLLWVVSLQAGQAGVLTVASGALLLALAAWALGLAQRAERGGRHAGRAVVAVSLLGVAAVLTRLVAAPLPTVQADREQAERFTPARLASLREEGRPVFVNMTAAWCVTCLVNERVALSPEAVREAFVRHRVAYLKGDWTRGDPEITSFLRDHARDGVPLYVLYRPGDAAPVVLPQILTEAEILSELDKLGG